tara:strand:+ start:7563 stop:7943 length:381 start_codon:yes stop_codon:yes gene_type:complete
MKNGAKKILNEIDKFDNIKSRRIIKSFENKIKREINGDILLYGDNGGLDDYTLKDLDYVILYYIWKHIDTTVNLEEILIILYSFYKLEEFHFNPIVFDTSRTFDIINKSNINNLIINILYIINEQL